MREATVSDIPKLINLGEQMHLESTYAKHPFDPEKCRVLAETLIQSSSGFIWLEEKEGEIIAWMAGGISEQWFSHQLVAFEYGLFVAQSQRGGTTAMRLLRKFKQWAVKNGAHLINLGITTGVHEDKTGGMYERMGFVKTGSLYVMEVN